VTYAAGERLRYYPNVDSADECRRLCLEDRRCAFWSLRPGSRCFLKGSGGEVDRFTLADSVSGWASGRCAGDAGDEKPKSVADMRKCRCREAPPAAPVSPRGKDGNGDLFHRANHENYDYEDFYADSSYDYELWDGDEGDDLVKVVLGFGEGAVEVRVKPCQRGSQIRQCDWGEPEELTTSAEATSATKGSWNRHGRVRLWSGVE